MTEPPRAGNRRNTIALVVLAHMVFINILAFIGDLPTTSLVSSILLGGFAIYLIATDRRD